MQTTAMTALIDLTGVLLRANAEGGLWLALNNEGITDAYMQSVTEALKVLGQQGIAEMERRYDIKVPDELKAERVCAAPVTSPLFNGKGYFLRYMQALLEDARELKQLKLEAHADYSDADLAQWDKRLDESAFLLLYLPNTGANIEEAFTQLFDELAGTKEREREIYARGWIHASSPDSAPTAGDDIPL